MKKTSQFTTAELAEITAIQEKSNITRKSAIKKFQKSGRKIILTHASTPVVDVKSRAANDNTNSDKNLRNSRFKKGSGTYACGCCKRQTRATGQGEESCDLCAECYEIAGYENYIADHSNDGDNATELAHAKAEIARLTEICRSKGGKFSETTDDTNDLVEKTKAPAPAKATSAPKPPVPSTPAGDARKEGIRLFQLAGKPTKTDFIHVYGAQGAKWTWVARAKAVGLNTAEEAAKEFQRMRAGKPQQFVKAEPTPETK